MIKFIPFCVSIIIIFLSLSGCAIRPVIGPTEKIQEPSISKNVIIILGLKFSGDTDFNTATVHINSSDRMVKAVGFLLKSKAPTDKKNRHIFSAYTEGSEHGYLVFDLPVDFVDKKINQFLLHLTRIGFSGMELEGINYSEKNTTFQNYSYYFDAPIGLHGSHPLGYNKDPKFSFYGCIFDIEKPGIYYLGELEINANLTIIESHPSGDIISKKRVHSKKVLAKANWSMSAYIDGLSIKEFLIKNDLNNSIIIDYGKYWRQISQKNILILENSAIHRSESNCV